MRYSIPKASRQSKARTQVSSQRARSSTWIARDQPSPRACSLLIPVNSSQARLVYSHDMSGRARHSMKGRASSRVTPSCAAGAMPQPARGPPVAGSLLGHGRRSALLTQAGKRYTRSGRTRNTRWAQALLPLVQLYPSLTKESVMLSWALAFFIIAIIAAIFGFTGIAAGAAEIAKILFVVLVVLYLV